MPAVFEYADDPESERTKQAVEHLTKMLGDKENFLSRLSLINTIITMENQISFGTAICGFLTAYRIINKGSTDKLLEIMASLGMLATAILDDIKEDKHAEAIATLMGGVIACTDTNFDETLAHLKKDFPGLKEQWEKIHNAREDRRVH